MHTHVNDSRLIGHRFRYLMTRTNIIGPTTCKTIHVAFPSQRSSEYEKAHSVVARVGRRRTSL